MFAAADSHETRIRMVSDRFSPSDQRFRLLIGKPLIHDFEDLLFGHAGVFQSADLFAGERRQTLDSPVQDLFDRGGREPDQF